MAPDGELPCCHALGQPEVHQPGYGPKDWRVLAVARPEPEPLAQRIQVN